MHCTDATTLNCRTSLGPKQSQCVGTVTLLSTRQRNERPRVELCRASRQSKKAELRRAVRASGQRKTPPTSVRRLPGVAMDSPLLAAPWAMIRDISFFVPLGSLGVFVPEKDPPSHPPSHGVRGNC